MNYSRGNAGDGGEAASGGLVPVSQQALLGRDPYSIAIPYGGDATADATPVFGLSLHEYLRILSKRKWLILSILGAAVVIGTLTTLMKTPLYTSTVRMQIDPQHGEDRASPAISRRTKVRMPTSCERNTSCSTAAPWPSVSLRR